MSEQKQISSLSILGVLLALGLMAAAFILGVQFKNLRQPGTITVKGLAEKNFLIALAVRIHARIPRRAVGLEVLDLLTARRKKLSKFLGEQGFTAAEMKVGLPEVSRVFNETRDELGNVTRTPNGYDGNLNIVVNTKKLDKIQAAQRAILNFRAQNEFIRFDNPQYLLGNLETIKRDLITQATEDAQKRAAEFAKTGGGKVGAMRSASQGSFNIYADTGSSEDDEYGGSYDKSTVGKQVRLVVTIEYGIE